MAPNERRVPWVAKVILNPKIVYGGEKRPSAEELARLHHQAHEQCFISQSVKTEVVVAGVEEGAG
jgi:organic hydroperoxide reductase OsmC/OhrA